MSLEDLSQYFHACSWVENFTAVPARDARTTVLQGCILQPRGNHLVLEITESTDYQHFAYTNAEGRSMRDAMVYGYYGYRIYDPITYQALVSGVTDDELELIKKVEKCARELPFLLGDVAQLIKETVGAYVPEVGEQIFMHWTGNSTQVVQTHTVMWSDEKCMQIKKVFMRDTLMDRFSHYRYTDNAIDKDVATSNYLHLGELLREVW